MALRVYEVPCLRIAKDEDGRVIIMQKYTFQMIMDKERSNKLLQLFSYARQLNFGIRPERPGRSDIYNVFGYERINPAKKIQENAYEIIKKTRHLPDFKNPFANLKEIKAPGDEQNEI